MHNTKAYTVLYRALCLFSLLVGIVLDAHLSPFEEFDAKAEHLPTFRSLYHAGNINKSHTSMLNEADDYRKLRCVTLELFEQTLDKFFSLIKEQLADTSHWFGSTDHLSQLLDKKNRKFYPYAQKLLLQHGSQFMCKGDLHGDMHSLVAFIKHLQEMGFTSPGDAFKIIKPDFTLIFHGDYVDRGIWGVEVLYLIMVLKIKNPEQVILIRGNHEDLHICNEYGFSYEFFSKFKDYAQADAKRVYKKIAKFYELLPVVLYIGSSSTKSIDSASMTSISMPYTNASDSKDQVGSCNDSMDFIQCCHGGMELGHNPKHFLASTSTSYQWIQSLERYTACKSLLRCTVVEHGRECPLSTICENFVPVSPCEPSPLGYLWSDFVVDPQGKNRCRYGRFAMNKELTHALLTAMSTPTHRVVGVIRAHQHTPSNHDPLMKLLLANHGCAVLWQNRVDSCVFKFEHGMVITLLLSPDSLMGVPQCGGSDYDGFDYDTCLLVTTSKKLEDWQLKVINNDIYKKRAHETGTLL